MFKSNNKLQALMFSLGLAAMILPATLNAQNGGGMFGLGPVSDNAEYSNRGGLLNPGGGNYNIGTQHFGEDVNGGYNIGTQQFGQDVPLGGGLFIMAVAGAGYALGKRKKNN